MGVWVLVRGLYGPGGAGLKAGQRAGRPEGGPEGGPGGWVNRLHT